MFHNIPISASLEWILYDARRELLIPDTGTLCSLPNSGKDKANYSAGFFSQGAGFPVFIKFVKVLLSNAHFILLTVKLLYTPPIT